MLIDDVVPRYHFRERHAIEVAAPSARVFAAVRETTLAETPIAFVLFRLRGIPASRTGALLDQLPERFTVLAEEPGVELVVGGIGQPWRLSGGMRSPTEFDAFDEPGYAKMALNFRLEGRTLTTETRVLLTDEAARRKFARYWLVVRFGSALVRRSWLRAIKRRAEANK